MKVKEIVQIIELIAPPEHAAAWDRSGIQVAARREAVNKMAVALDPSQEMVDAAMEWGAHFVLTHHPLALKPGLPDQMNAYHHVLSSIMAHDAWLYAAHTSLDVQPGGPVRWLATKLGLQNLTVLEPTGTVRQLWFRILGQSGAIGILMQQMEEFADVEQYRLSTQALELVCPSRLGSTVWDAVKGQDDASLRVISRELDHPVEIIGFGFVGSLPEPEPWEALERTVRRLLGSSAYTIAGPVPETIQRVACCPGSGASILPVVGRTGADIFITGDLKYHDARRAEELGIFVLDVGHFSMEEGMMRKLTEQLQTILTASGVEVVFFPAQEALVHRC